MAVRPDTSRAAQVAVALVQNQVLVTLPWEHADRCREYLRRQGIGSTLVLDTPARTAHLELWANVPAERVAELLRAGRR
jgi:hypothetical protein